MRFFLLVTNLLVTFAITRAQDAETAAASAASVAAVVKNLNSRDGTKIYAEAAGNPNGPHVIFAHGLACTSAAFDSIFADKVMLSTLYMVRYDTRGHVSNRSLAGAIGADIATNFPSPLPFSGLIWLAALPYLGDILPKVATDTVLSFLPGLQDTTNTAFGLQTRIDFVDTLSALPNVPYATKLGWVGSSVFLPPAVASLALGRTQDPSRLLQEAAAGWPLLILHGTADKQINGTAVINNMAPLFKNVESHLIKGAGHIPFYDAEPTVSAYILAFIARVKLTNPYP
ncbi:hypothetical protein H0H81_012724 [Sphagnurus paluster]|uniref:Alpha/beta-hydrolase n=1 Tax=Sphagnurus paluster TaxID=117069 RepID=A0A9P7KK55_9AGAR|nr:hypothetical protein H0H81_012724 [Sphagnurus paluster]